MLRQTISIVTAMTLTCGTIATPVLASEVSAADTVRSQASIPQAQYDASMPVVIVIDKSTFNTYVLQLHDGVIYRVFTARNSHGTRDYPTPTGRFVIDRIVPDPIWKSPWTGEEIAPYSRNHGNPMGDFAITLIRDSPGQPVVPIEEALHGTNRPELVGGFTVSHGCIRHLNADIAVIAGMARRDTVVWIVDAITSNFSIPSIDFTFAQPAELSGSQTAP